MSFIIGNLKGILLCLFITLLAISIQELEIILAGVKLIDALIISLILGVVIGNFYLPFPKIFSKSDLAPKFASKQLLEFAVMFLGFNINFALLKQNGLHLIFLAITSVAMCLLLIYLFCRNYLKLDKNISLLIATGNAICGNSAIAALASVIKANPTHVAIAISFSAIIGLFQVIFLPLLSFIGGISDLQYGIIAGISVYAVPQVVAASFIVSSEAGMIATQVKLIRVLTLGPILLLVSFLKKSNIEENEKKSIFFSINKYIPWFIIGFAIATILGSLNILPNSLIDITNMISKFLFIVAMAGIGLTVNLREMKTDAPKVALAVILAMILMIAIAVIGTSMFNLK